MDEIVNTIRKRIAADMHAMPESEIEWVRAHLIEPRPVRFAIDAEGTELKDFWLVTDHVGNQDSSYRVAYDPSTDGFGLEMTTIDGVEWYMGSYGEFINTIVSM